MIMGAEPQEVGSIGEDQGLVFTIQRIAKKR